MCFEKRYSLLDPSFFFILLQVLVGLLISNDLYQSDVRKNYKYTAKTYSHDLDSFCKTNIHIIKRTIYLNG